MIVFEGVSYRYPGQDEGVLQNLHLEIGAGEIFLVAGPSGSGKSSLLRCLNGLVPHFHGGSVRGTVRVAGRDPLILGPRGMSDEVAFVGQDPESHFVTRVVEDELAFGMENHAVSPAQMVQRIDEVLTRLEIEGLRHRDIETLSGGERQRVAIASVLTLRPSVLVLDEPTSQLDPEAAEEVIRGLERLNRETGMTIVLSEHRLERVLGVVGRMVLLGEGPPRIGSPQEILPGTSMAPPIVELTHALPAFRTCLQITEAFEEEAYNGLREALSSKAPTVPEESSLISLLP